MSNPNYNNYPEYMKEIPVEEWGEGMFGYNIEPVECRQVTETGKVCHLRMFNVPNFEDKKLGFAVMYDFHDNETGRNRKKAVYRFFQYGSDADWEKFNHRFAAQFAGDNS